MGDAPGPLVGRHPARRRGHAVAPREVTAARRLDAVRMMVCHVHVYGVSSASVVSKREVRSDGPLCWARGDVSRLSPEELP